MKLQVTVTAAVLFIAAVCLASLKPTEIPSAGFETRCGWFTNPTPANVWLFDREAEWTIGVQGGYQLDGDWPWPIFKRGQWVRTNTGNYGYGCACLQLRVNQQTHEVIEIKSARARLLAQCRNDPALKKWNRKGKW